MLVCSGFEARNPNLGLYLQLDAQKPVCVWQKMMATLCSGTCEEWKGRCRSTYSLDLLISFLQFVLQIKSFHQIPSAFCNGMVNAWFLQLGACGAESHLTGTSLWCDHHSYIAKGKGRGCGDKAGGRASHWGGSASQLPGEGDEHGILNQQNHLPCLGQESLDFITASPLPIHFQFCGLTSRFKHKR